MWSVVIRLLQHKQRLDDLEQLLGATAPISDASNGTVSVALGSQNGFAPAGSAANSTTQLRGTDVAVPLTPFCRQQPASTGRENEPRDTSLRGLDIEAPATFMRSVQSRISTREPSLQAARATSKDPVKTALIDMNQAQQLFEMSVIFLIHPFDVMLIGHARIRSAFGDTAVHCAMCYAQERRDRFDVSIYVREMGTDSLEGICSVG